MIRIALSNAAYDAIAATLPKGSARWPMQRDGDQGFIQVEAAVVDRMRAMRRPGESYSEVILRLVGLKKSEPKKAVRLSWLRGVASHGNGRAAEGQSRDNKIGVALGLGTETSTLTAAPYLQRGRRMTSL